MNIALYFGSFNPIHNGHLLIASHIADNKHVDQVWLVLSPQNPLKPQSSLLNEYSRLHLAQIATEGEKKIKVSNIEFQLPKPSYTIDTLTYLKEKHPNYNYSIIMGSDSFQNIVKWKNYKTLITNHKILIYPRPNYTIDNNINANIEILKTPLLEISSTEIRNRIKDKKSIRYWLPQNVQEEIEKSAYYK